MLQIRDERVNRLAEKLASINRSTKTDAVRVALENDLQARGTVLSHGRGRVP